MARLTYNESGVTGGRENATADQVFIRVITPCQETRLILTQSGELHSVCLTWRSPRYTDRRPSRFESAEPDSVAVRIDFARRAELMAAAPDVYYLTDHYVNYPVVLVRLSRIHSDGLRDLLGVAWRFVSTKPPGRKHTIRLTGGNPVTRRAK